MLIRAGALSQDQPGADGEARGGRLTARDHAQRFLDACPEDVRAAVIRRGDIRLRWDRQNGHSVEVTFDNDGGVAFLPDDYPGYQSVRFTTIDRLLSGYTHPQDRSPANESTATATATNSQGLGKRMGGEAP